VYGLGYESVVKNMLFGFRFGNMRRQVYSREIDVASSEFHLSRRRLVRIVLTASPLFMLSGLAYYFEQPFGMWFSAAIALFVILWQIVFYGYERPGDERAIDVTNIYPRPYLIGIGIFWLGLIAFVAWRLWVQFPGHQH
jgi:hypothetical protein